MKINKIDLQKVNLFNYPKPLKLEDYWEVCDLAIADLKNSSDVISVYLCGSKWLLGISDLDLLVVYRNKQKSNKIKLPWQISDKAKSIFIHRYENYNQDSFPWFAYLIPRFNEIQLLVGQKLNWYIPENELNQEDYQWLQAGFIFDLLINKLLLFFRYQYQAEINIRELLLVTSSLAHTLKMVEKTGHLLMGSEDFCKKITSLRNNWFNHNYEYNIDSLLDLFIDAQGLILEIVKKLDEFVKIKLPDFTRVIKNDTFYLINPKFKLEFIPNWNEEIFFSNFKKGLIKFEFPFLGKKPNLDSYRLLLPSTLFYFILVYSHESGLFSQWLKKSIRGRGNHLLDTFKVSEGLKKHIYAFNKQAEEGAKVKKGESLKIWFSYGFFPYHRSIKRKIVDFIILIIRTIKK